MRNELVGRRRGLNGTLARYHTNLGRSHRVHTLGNHGPQKEKGRRQRVDDTFVQSFWKEWQQQLQTALHERHQFDGMRIGPSPPGPYIQANGDRVHGMSIDLSVQVYRHGQSVGRLFGKFVVHHGGNDMKNSVTLLVGHER